MKFITNRCQFLLNHWSFQDSEIQFVFALKMISFLIFKIQIHHFLFYWKSPIEHKKAEWLQVKKLIQIKKNSNSQWPFLLNMAQFHLLSSKKNKLMFFYFFPKFMLNWILQLISPLIMGNILTINFNMCVIEQKNINLIK